MNENNIIGILDITDSNGDEWYEVDYLAQDAVYDSIKNSNPNDPNLSSDTNIAYLLKTKQVAKRFATRFLNKNILYNYNLVQVILEMLLKEFNTKSK